MDAEFLDHTVHNALTEGLACTVAARPKDPVDYLGNYLLHHAHRIEAEQKVCWHSLLCVLCTLKYHVCIDSTARGRRKSARGTAS